jgi:hypothetical protein
VGLFAKEIGGCLVKLVASNATARQWIVDPLLGHMGNKRLHLWLTGNAFAMARDLVLELTKSKEYVHTEI